MKITVHFHGGLDVSNRDVHKLAEGVHHKLNALLRGQRCILQAIDCLANHRDDEGKIRAMSETVRSHTAELQAAIDANETPPMPPAN